MLVIALMLSMASSTFAGGGWFEIRVIAFDRAKGMLVFQPLGDRSGGRREGAFAAAAKVTLLLKYACDRGFFTCLFGDRVFDRKDHAEALAHLAEIARPGARIRFGFVGGGFYPHPEQPDTYVSRGLFMADGVVYSYEKPFL